MISTLGFSKNWNSSGHLFVFPLLAFLTLKEPRFAPPASRTIRARAVQVQPPPRTAFLPRCSPPGSPALHPHSSPQHRKHYGPKLNFLGLTCNQFLSQLNPIICGITTHTSSQTGSWQWSLISFFLSTSWPISWKVLSSCQENISQISSLPPTSVPAMLV